MNLLTNVKGYDWATWLMGILRSVTTGGATGVLSAPVSMGIDPDHFNFGAGLHKTLAMMSAMFIGSAIIHMCVFLQTHGAPEKTPEPPNP